MFQQPTFRFKSVDDITVNFLIKNNIKLIIFDADSTLIKAKSSFLEEKVKNKIQEIIDNNIQTAIASNGRIHRINKVFVDFPNVKVYPLSLKPFSFRVRKILKEKNIPKDNVVLIGDQFFTDIICANILKIKSIMVEPYLGDSGLFMKFKRYIEKKILK